MLQITLTQNGYGKPITAMTSAEVYETGRYAWVLGAQADREAYSLIVYNNTVLQAVEIESLEDVVVTDKKKGLPQNRRAIHGNILTAGHPVYDKFVGNVAPKPSTQNPIKYVEDELDLTASKSSSVSSSTRTPSRTMRLSSARNSPMRGVGQRASWSRVSTRYRCYQCRT